MTIQATEAIDVARALHRLSYLEMMDLAESLCGTIRQREEDGEKPDCTDRDTMADILRWWAECRIDAVESE
jgi:hypothetical protein